MKSSYLHFSIPSFAFLHYSLVFASLWISAVQSLISSLVLVHQMPLGHLLAIWVLWMTKYNRVMFVKRRSWVECTDHYHMVCGCSGWRNVWALASENMSFVECIDRCACHDWQCCYVMKNNSAWCIFNIHHTQ